MYSNNPALPPSLGKYTTIAESATFSSVPGSQVEVPHAAKKSIISLCDSSIITYLSA